jgi:hypothetical protein
VKSPTGSTLESVLALEGEYFSLNLIHNCHNMDGLFKKTMSYLNAEGVAQDEFVGKIVEVASIKLKILRKIAEGKEEKRRKFPFPLLLSRCFWCFVERPTTCVSVISGCGRMLKLDGVKASSLITQRNIV